MSRLLRAVIIVAVGLGLAFGVFYLAGWPSTLKTLSPGGDQIAFPDAARNELLHVGLGPVVVVGTRNVEIVSARLIDPSPGLELVAIRISPVGPTENFTTGTARGIRADIDRLPSAAGSILRSQRGAFVVVTVRSSTLGSYRFRGVLIRYRSGLLTRTLGLGPTVAARVVVPTPSPSG